MLRKLCLFIFAALFFTILQTQPGYAGFRTKVSVSETRNRTSEDVNSKATSSEVAHKRRLISTLLAYSSDRHYNPHHSHAPTGLTALHWYLGFYVCGALAFLIFVLANAPLAMLALLVIPAYFFYIAAIVTAIKVRRHNGANRGWATAVLLLTLNFLSIPILLATSRRSAGRRQNNRRGY